MRSRYRINNESVRTLHNLDDCPVAPRLHDIGVLRYPRGLVRVLPSRERSARSCLGILDNHFHAIVSGLQLARTLADLMQKLEYLHNNPVERGLVASPEHWRYSSAHEWLAGAVPVMRVDPWR